MTDPVASFIARWQGVTASELATAQSFVIGLCRLLDLPEPHATVVQDYMFERPISFKHGDGGSSPGRIDCYRRGCFVLEAKKLKVGAGKTASFDDALLRARSQAEGYARALPADEGRPPFLIVVDVGNVIELYAEFSRTGATYVPYPDPRSHRIRLADLRDKDIRDRLRNIWLDPLALDPTRQSAKVTREIAAHLAEVAKSLEQAGHAPETVAGFLTRCLFSMFAEDVALIPKGSFTELLKSLADNPTQFVPLVNALWKEMDTGGFSVVLRQTLPRFNGKLFKHPEVVPLDKAQIARLLEASKADWTQVEPAIFGTLLERALDPAERHALGAHYTPRAYVDRLVQPTVIEPLRQAWAYVQGAAVLLANEGKHKEAIAELRNFHHHLCHLRVLDPACGSGNFLYVALEHLKRLEGEVLNQLHDLGETQSLLEAEGLTVDPHQFLGLEINPRAAAIAELVLWIGYLQWHFRTQGSGLPPSPILKDFRNIACRDAVLDEGKPATWPAADVIVGNPPFIGASTMRAALGDAYVEALRNAWQQVPDSADFVMFWWHHAAQLVAQGKTVLARHADLTLTGLYNVLAKVGAGGTALTAKEQAIYDKGLVGVLKSLHDDLDVAVLDAYGWQDNPSDEQILERLVQLNAARAAEEAQGHIRWLRPEFQNPRGASPAGLGDARPTICDSHEEAGRLPAPPTTWPTSLPEQMAALANALTAQPQSETELAARFTGKGRWKSRLPELLATLATLGRARKLEDGRWMG